MLAPGTLVLEVACEHIHDDGRIFSLLSDEYESSGESSEADPEGLLLDSHSAFIASSPGNTTPGILSVTLIDESCFSVKFVPDPRASSRRAQARTHGRFGSSSIASSTHRDGNGDGGDDCQEDEARSRANSDSSLLDNKDIARSSPQQRVRGHSDDSAFCADLDSARILSNHCAVYFAPSVGVHYEADMRSLQVPSSQNMADRSLDSALSSRDHNHSRRHRHRRGECIRIRNPQEFALFKEAYEECQSIAQIVLRIQSVSRDAYFSGVYRDMRMDDYERTQALQDRRPSAAMLERIHEELEQKKVDLPDGKPINGQAAGVLIPMSDQIRCVFCDLERATDRMRLYMEHPYVRTGFGGKPIYMCVPCVANWYHYRISLEAEAGLILPDEINEELCAICSDTPGELVLCGTCVRSFCKPCLLRACTTKALEDLENEEQDWTCMCCCNGNGHTPLPHVQWSLAFAPSTRDAKSFSRPGQLFQHVRELAEAAARKVKVVTVEPVEVESVLSADLYLDLDLDATQPQIVPDSDAMDSEGEPEEAEVDAKEEEGKIDVPAIGNRKLKSRRDSRTARGSRRKNTKSDKKAPQLKTDARNVLRRKVNADKKEATASTSDNSLIDMLPMVQNNRTKIGAAARTSLLYGAAAARNSGQWLKMEHDISELLVRDSEDVGASVIKKRANGSKHKSRGDGTSKGRSKSGGSGGAVKAKGGALVPVAVSIAKGRDALKAPPPPPPRKGEGGGTRPSNSTVHKSLPPVTHEHSEAYYFSQYVQYVDHITADENEFEWAHSPLGFHTDEVCFLCKDGGELVECDHARAGCNAKSFQGKPVAVAAKCRKVYHEYCLAYSVPDDGTQWHCPRHYCDGCGSANLAHICKYCPISFCADCLDTQCTMKSYSQLAAPKYGWEFNQKAQSICCGTCVRMFESCDREGHPIVPSNPKKARPVHPVLTAPFIAIDNSAPSAVFDSFAAKPPPQPMSAQMQAALSKKQSSSGSGSGSSSSSSSQAERGPSRRPGKSAAADGAGKHVGSPTQYGDFLSMDAQFASNVVNRAELAEMRAIRAQHRDSNKPEPLPLTFRVGSKKRVRSGREGASASASASASTSASASASAHSDAADLVSDAIAETSAMQLHRKVHADAVRRLLCGAVAAAAPDAQMPSVNTDATSNPLGTSAATVSATAATVFAATTTTASAKVVPLAPVKLAGNAQASNMLQNVMAHYTAGDADTPTNAGLTFRIPMPADTNDEDGGYSSYL